MSLYPCCCLVCTTDGCTVYYSLHLRYLCVRTAVCTDPDPCVCPVPHTRPAVSLGFPACPPPMDPSLCCFVVPFNTPMWPSGVTLVCVPSALCWRHPCDTWGPQLGGDSRGGRPPNRSALSLRRRARTHNACYTVTDGLAVGHVLLTACGVLEEGGTGRLLPEWRRKETWVCGVCVSAGDVSASQGLNTG